MDNFTSFVILFIASFLIWIMALGVIALWLLGKNKKRGMLISISISVVIAAVVSQLIKTIFPFDRPFEIYGIDPLTLTVPQDGSFPSSHTAIAFALAFSLYEYYKKYAPIFFIGATLVAVGRITSQVHFLGDVAGGILVGYLGHKLTYIYFNKKALDN